MFDTLASYRRSVERIRSKWSEFSIRRRERLVQQQRHGHAAEKVAENILEDLFTMVLDWPLTDMNNQIGYADLLLTNMGIKYLIVEVKQPGALAWHQKAVSAALEQARRYADEQKVRCIAVSDGVMLYAADICHGGLQDRVFASLEQAEPPECLWWLSVHGIYRSCVGEGEPPPRLLPPAPNPPPVGGSNLKDGLIHPKYKLSAACFAYVGDANDTKSWKLPHLLQDGSVDTKRLPKAIQCIISNFRGTKVSGIPEIAIPSVLVRLAQAAVKLGKMPHQSGEPAPVYLQLAAILEQLGRLDEIVNSLSHVSTLRT